MKSVLITTRPQWVEKICHKIGEDETGKAIYEKRIEVRKSAPKEAPFKAYIYETQGQYIKFIHGAHTKYGYGCGKVIGEFICDKVYMSFIGYMKNEPCYWGILNGSCLTKDEIMNYGKWKTLYGWHISDLKIYNKPRELSEFRKPCDWNYDCCTCKRAKYELTKAEAKVFYGCNSELTRPPQSWCYVEELQRKEK